MIIFPTEISGSINRSIHHDWPSAQAEAKQLSPEESGGDIAQAVFVFATSLGKAQGAGAFAIGQVRENAVMSQGHCSKRVRFRKGADGGEMKPRISPEKICSRSLVSPDQDSPDWPNP